MLFVVAISGFRPAIEWQYRRHTADPVQLLREHHLFHQCVVVVALDCVNNITLHILFRHVPGLPLAANSQPLALTDGVVISTLVFTDGFTVQGLYFSGLGRQESAEKIAEPPLANKADPRAVFFVMGG